MTLRFFGWCPARTPVDDTRGVADHAVSEENFSPLGNPSKLLISALDAVNGT